MVNTSKDCSFFYFTVQIHLSKLHSNIMHLFYTVYMKSSWNKIWGPPGTPVHRISQARILEWVAVSVFRGSSHPRDQAHVSCIAGRFFTI